MDQQITKKKKGGNDMAGGKVLDMFGIGKLESQSLDLMEICVARYPTSKWTDLNVNQQAELISKMVLRQFLPRRSTGP